MRTICNYLSLNDILPPCLARTGTWLLSQRPLIAQNICSPLVARPQGLWRLAAPNQSNIYRKVEVGVKVSHVASSSQRNKENEWEWEVKDIKFHSKQFLIDSQSSETLHPSHPFTPIFVCVTSVANSFPVFVFFLPLSSPRGREEERHWERCCVN